MKYYKLSAWNTEGKEYVHYFMGDTESLKNEVYNLASFWCDVWNYAPVVVEELTEQEFFRSAQ